VIRVLIDHDIVTIPKPVIDEAVIIRRNTEVGAVKPETIPVPAPKVKNMLTAEPAVEASVFEWAFNTVMGIVTPGIMSYPRAVCVNVGSFRVSRPIGKGPAFWHVRLASGRLLHRSRRRTASGYMPTAKLTMLSATLRKSRNKCNRQHCKKPNSLLHDRCLQVPLEQLGFHLLRDSTNA
jgi:hypothetical protein